MAGLTGLVHPVFWPEGYMSDFGEYSRWYQQDLYDRYFQPNNTTLVFVGGVTLEEMIPQVERYFGWMERRRTRRLGSAKRSALSNVAKTWCRMRFAFATR